MTEADQSDAAMITKEGSHTLEAVKFLPGTDPPLELLEVTQYCEHLVFSHIYNLSWISDLQDAKIMNLRCFKQLSLW